VISVELTGPNPRLELFFVLSVLLPRFWTSRKICAEGVTMNFPSPSVIELLSAAPNIDYIFIEEPSATLTIRVTNPSQCPKLFNALVAMGEAVSSDTASNDGGNGVSEPVYEDDLPPTEEDYETRYTKLLAKISLECGSCCKDCQRNIFDLVNNELYVGGDDPDDFAVALRSLHNSLINSPIHEVEKVIQKTFPQDDSTYDKIKEAVLALNVGHFFAMRVGQTNVFAHSLTIGEGSVAQRINQLRAHYNKKNIY
jgi:hypothetical protein